MAPDPERLAFLDEVYNGGCLNWDTAEGYADSEELIGKWFARSGKRNEVGISESPMRIAEGDWSGFPGD